MQIVHKDWKMTLLQLFTGALAQAALPATIYMGLRVDTPAPGDTLATISGNEVAGAGYARVAITRSAASLPDAATGNDWQIALAQQAFPAFTGPPSPNGATHWFITDQATGYAGKLYHSGPLNPAAVAATLSAAAAAAATTLTIPAASAALLNVADYLLVGTTGTSADQERVKVSAVNTGTGVVTLAAGLVNAHASGEPVTRDGSTRNYQSGYSEQVTVAIQLVQG